MRQLLASLLLGSLCGLAGCSRLGFGVSPDAGDGPPSDGPGDLPELRSRERGAALERNVPPDLVAGRDGPIKPGALGDICTMDLTCPPGSRCIFGYSTIGRCTRVCPDGSCPTGELCFDVVWEGKRACLKSCAPLESPSRCSPWEVCYPNPELMKAYCINGVGDPTTCNATGKVCVTGKMCVGGSCKPVCDETHPCATTCATILYGGNTLPWMACK